MRKLILAFLFAVTVLLDLLALDDITTGNEPSFLGEYIVLIISVPALFVSAYLLYRKKPLNTTVQKKNY